MNKMKLVYLYSSFEDKCFKTNMFRPREITSNWSIEIFTRESEIAHNIFEIFFFSALKTGWEIGRSNEHFGKFELLFA